MSGIKVTLGQKSAELTGEDVKKAATIAGKNILAGLKKGTAFLGRQLNKASVAMEQLDTDQKASKTV